ncbi:MAG: hypothetical protein IJY70_01220 [Clostridia bacterium]|nr:hypothetical protein [Clostridia bacterium]
MSKSERKKSVDEPKIVAQTDETTKPAEPTAEEITPNLSANEKTDLSEKIEKIYILVSAIAQSVLEEKKGETDEEIIQRIMSSDEVRATIIADYLKSLGSKNAVSVLNGQVGATPLTPINKPKSLADAKKLAELLIKR